MLPALLNPARARRWASNFTLSIAKQRGAAKADELSPNELATEMEEVRWFARVCCCLSKSDLSV